MAFKRIWLLFVGHDSDACSAAVQVRTVGGDHVRPLTQALGQLPDELSSLAQSAAAQGSDFLGRFSSLAAQAGFPQEVCRA